MNHAVPDQTDVNQAESCMVRQVTDHEFVAIWFALLFSPIPGVCCSCGYAQSMRYTDREKLQGVEAKLRSTIQDKANVQSEKANIERQLKTLQAQTGKLTKVECNCSTCCLGKEHILSACLHLLLNREARAT